MNGTDTTRTNNGQRTKDKGVDIAHNYELTLTTEVYIHVSHVFNYNDDNHRRIGTTTEDEAGI